MRDARPDRLYHLAAPTFVPGSWDDPAGTLRVIGEATATVLELARELDLRVAVAASPEIFGDAGVSPQDEDSPKRPRSPYGVAKLAAHELVRVMREGRGVHACSVITYNHESPRRPERFVTRKITRGAAAIRLGLEDELALGDLGARRDWSHARDIVRGIALALDHDSRATTCSPAAWRGPSATSSTRRSRRPAWTRPGTCGWTRGSSARRSRRVLVGDPSRARSMLGWEPEVSFEQLVREMVQADLRQLRQTSS